MYNPLRATLSTAETTLWWAVCQAKIVPFGQARRGYRRNSFLVATTTPKKPILSFSAQSKAFRSALLIGPSCTLSKRKSSAIPIHFPEDYEE
jgi:hypothetical protein